MAVVDDLTEKIMEQIKARAAPSAGDVTLDTDLSALGIHSLELTEIIFDLEDEFGIQIDMSTADAWNELKTVGDMVAAVRKLILAKEGQA